MKKGPLTPAIPMLAIAVVAALCSQSTAYADCSGTPRTVSTYKATTSISFTCELNEDNSSYAASIKDKLRINDSDYLLYPTFDNPKKAIEAIQSDARTILNLLSSKYDLEELSPYNWELYRTAMLDMHDNIDKPDWYTNTQATITNGRLPT